MHPDTRRGYSVYSQQSLQFHGFHSPSNNPKGSPSSQICYLQQWIGTCPYQKNWSLDGSNAGTHLGHLRSYEFLVHTVLLHRLYTGRRNSTSLLMPQRKPLQPYAYMRTTSFMNDQVSFVLGNAKVAPTHALTMPRLKTLHHLIGYGNWSVGPKSPELTFNLTKCYSASKVMFGYLTNRTKRFYINVPNRVQRVYYNTLDWTSGCTSRCTSTQLIFELG